MEILILLVAMLTEWLDDIYFPTYKQRLTDSVTYVTGRLAKLGVTVHPSKAGFFAWADMSKVLLLQHVGSMLSLGLALKNNEPALTISTSLILENEDPYFNMILNLQ